MLALPSRTCNGPPCSCRTIISLQTRRQSLKSSCFSTIFCWTSVALACYDRQRGHSNRPSAQQTCRTLANRSLSWRAVLLVFTSSLSRHWKMLARPMNRISSSSKQWRSSALNSPLAPSPAMLPGLPQRSSLCYTAFIIILHQQHQSRSLQHLLISRFHWFQRFGCSV